MTTLPSYVADVSQRLRNTSASISRDFATHRPSSGGQREECVLEFLRQHIPKRFGIASGLVISYDGLFSNQADVLIVDRMNNAPLYSGSRNELWPAEAVYTLIEVKSELSPRELADIAAKARRFKTLNRHFCPSDARLQRTTDSLFCVWAFDAPSHDVLIKNIQASISGIPRAEPPDLWVVLDRFVARSGTYLEVSTIGAPGSRFRTEAESQGAEAEALPRVSVGNGEDALLAWYVWLDSWLRQAGDRLCDPVKYIIR